MHHIVGGGLEHPKNASEILSITSSNRKVFLSRVARRVVCKQTKSAGEGSWLSGRAGVVE